MRILILCLFLTACAEKQTPQFYFDLSFLGKVANEFQQGPSFKLEGVRVVDSSILNVNGKLKLFFDWGDGKSFGVTDLGTGYSEGKAIAQSMGLNFTYTLFHNNEYFTFGEFGNDIYLEKSSDGVTWARINGGHPVLTHSSDPSSPYNQLWNVGVAVDSNEVWHLTAECSDSAPDQLHVGICYSEANMLNDSIDFDQNRSADQIIKHAGNPDIKVIEGKGLLIIHGAVYDPYATFGNEWYVTASTLGVGKTAWTTHKNQFVIGTPHIHDCDPHLVEDPAGGLTLVLSVNQSHVSTAHSKTLNTYQELFDAIIE